MKKSLHSQTNTSIAYGAADRQLTTPLKRNVHSFVVESDLKPMTSNWFSALILFSVVQKSSYSGRYGSSFLLFEVAFRHKIIYLLIVHLMYNVFSFSMYTYRHVYVLRCFFERIDRKPRKINRFQRSITEYRLVKTGYWRHHTWPLVQWKAFNDNYSEPIVEWGELDSQSGKPLSRAQGSFSILLWSRLAASSSLRITRITYNRLHCLRRSSMDE